MTKPPFRSEDELLAKLEKWLAALGRQPTLAELVQSGDGDLFAAFTLMAFRRGARKAVLARLERAAPAFELATDGSAAMRVFAGLSTAWQLTPAEQVQLLGLESSHQIDDVRGVEETELSIGVIERSAILLDIFEAIKTLLPEPNRADAWVRSVDSHPLFGGQSALALMMSGLDGLYQTRRYLLAEQSNKRSC